MEPDIFYIDDIKDDIILYSKVFKYGLDINIETISSEAPIVV